MSAKYSIVQYVPNPIAGERINIGVITWDDANVRARFITNWSRARHFGGENPEFLRDFADNVYRLTVGDKTGHRRGSEYLEKIIREWHESIQFTDPRGSLDDADALLDTISSRVLREGPTKQPTIRRRSFAARAAYRHLYKAVKELAPDRAAKLVRQREVIRGELVTHKFDVVVGNGTLVAGVNALSFEVKLGDALQKEIDAIAWAIDDVRKREQNIPLAIFALPPPDDAMHALFDRANKTFRGLSATVLTTDISMTRWSHAQAEAVTAH